MTVAKRDPQSKRWNPQIAVNVFWSPEASKAAVHSHKGGYRLQQEAFHTQRLPAINLWITLNNISLLERRPEFKHSANRRWWWERRSECLISSYWGHQPKSLHYPSVALMSSSLHLYLRCHCAEGPKPSKANWNMHNWKMQIFSECVGEAAGIIQTLQVN